MFVVTVIFTVDSNHIDKFMPAMLENARQSLSLETACRTFDVCQATENPNRVFLYEIYDNAESFQLHLESTHFKQFDQKTAGYIVDKQVHTWTRKA